MYDSFTKMLNAAKTGDVTARREVAHTFLYENDMEELELEITDLCLRYLNEAAESGDPDAMMDLGGMYLTGRGVPYSRDEALRWYLQAAGKMHPLAFNRIAQVFLYDEDEEGLGYLPPTNDPVRLQKAYEFFCAGAKLGEAGCMNELGVMYMVGECVEPDFRKGFRWFKKAHDEATVCDTGDKAQAAYSLAKCYHYGEGTEQNLSLAVRYALEAIELNEEEYEAGCTGSHYFVEEAEEELLKILTDMKCTDEEVMEYVQEYTEAGMTSGKTMDTLFKVVFRVNGE